MKRSKKLITLTPVLTLAVGFLFVVFLFTGYAIGHSVQDRNLDLQNKALTKQVFNLSQNTQNYSQENGQVLMRKKVTQDFPLTNYNGFVYKLQWDQFKIDQKDNSADNILTQANYSSPLRLIKSADNFKTVILVKVLEIDFRIGYFTLVKGKTTANQVAFSQAAGFSDAHISWVINLDTGDVKKGDF